MTELIIIIVPGYGYIPTIKIDGKETYRGAYQETEEDALKKCKARNDTGNE